MAIMMIMMMTTKMHYTAVWAHNLVIVIVIVYMISCHDNDDDSMTMMKRPVDTPRHWREVRFRQKLSCAHCVASRHGWQAFLVIDMF